MASRPSRNLKRDLSPLTLGQLRLYARGLGLVDIGNLKRPALEARVRQRQAAVQKNMRGTWRRFAMWRRQQEEAPNG